MYFRCFYDLTFLIFSKIALSFSFQMAFSEIGYKFQVKSTTSDCLIYSQARIDFYLHNHKGSSFWSMDFEKAFVNSKTC